MYKHNIFKSAFNCFIVEYCINSQDQNVHPVLWLEIYDICIIV